MSCFDWSFVSLSDITFSFSASSFSLCFWVRFLIGVPAHSCTPLSYSILACESPIFQAYVPMLDRYLRLNLFLISSCLVSPILCEWFISQTHDSSYYPQLPMTSAITLALSLRFNIDFSSSSESSSESSLPPRHDDVWKGSGPSWSLSGISRSFFDF